MKMSDMIGTDQVLHLIISNNYRHEINEKF